MIINILMKRGLLNMFLTLYQKKESTRPAKSETDVLLGAI